MNEGLPREIRRCASQGRRVVADWLTGRRGRFVSPNGGRESAAFPIQLTLDQPILNTEYVQAKRHNLELARGRVENRPIPLGGIFSFWHLVGRPTPQRGFQAGRSLLGGQLRPDFGGGRCQLSGAIYHLSLLTGLRILERHAHSVDIYDDPTRYTPLGADATAAYGFKDLRVENPLAAPICFRISLSQARITCALCSTAPVQACRVEFVRSGTCDGKTKVETWAYRPGQATGELIAVSTYGSVRTNRENDQASQIRMKNERHFSK